MNRQEIIEKLTSQFEEKIRGLSDDKLEGIKSGYFEISLTQAVGNEAGGHSMSESMLKRHRDQK